MDDCKKGQYAIVGDIGFHGNPNEKYEVEIGFGLVEHERKNNFGFEALKAIINWAISHSSVKIIKNDFV